MIELTFIYGGKRKVKFIEIIDYLFFLKVWRDDEGRTYHLLSIIKIEEVI